MMMMMMMMMMMFVLSNNDSTVVNAFSLQHPHHRHRILTPMPSTAAVSVGASIGSGGSSATALYGAMNRRNKHADMAAKMAEAKRLRELDDSDDTATSSIAKEKEKPLSASEIKERNDRQRFADLLENSLTSGGGSDMDKGYYLTEAQENESADAVCECAFFSVVSFSEGRNGIFILVFGCRTLRACA